MKMRFRRWVKHRLVFCVVTAAFLAGRPCVPLVSAAATNDIASPSLDWQKLLVCGPNSLFTFLILSGQTRATYEQINDALPRSAEGVGMLTMRDVARKFGIDCEIKKYRPEEIDSVPLPAIGQFWTYPTSMTRAHFDVLYQVGPEWAYLINGTSGKPYRMRRTVLPVKWTGYAMSEKRSLAKMVRNQWQFVIAAAVLLLLDYVSLTRLLRRTKARSGHKQVLAG